MRDKISNLSRYCSSFPRQLERLTSFKFQVSGFELKAGTLSPRRFVIDLGTRAPVLTNSCATQLETEMGNPKPRTLDEWLHYLERLHPQAIVMGLDRVLSVSRALALAPGYPIITVGGTNGKGSCCAMLEAILLHAGYRVGCYTSPHLLRYNERVRIGGREVDDAVLCAAFERIEEARRSAEQGSAQRSGDRGPLAGCDRGADHRRVGADPQRVFGVRSPGAPLPP